VLRLENEESARSAMPDSIEPNLTGSILIKNPRIHLTGLHDIVVPSDPEPQELQRQDEENKS
jgi:hypothetical protein